MTEPDFGAGVTVVFGPAGTGKSTHAETMRAHYGCGRVVDDWSPDSGERPVAGDLVLTNAHIASIRRALPEARLVHINAAREALGLLRE